ncbi:Leucine rich repeat containing protein BspA family protein [Entamoeba marina]
MIKTLDSYSLLIVSKYLKRKKDFINVMCVCKKFQETTEKLRFNPIPITSLKLFPKIQTQYLYHRGNKRVKGIDNYEMWYEINYTNYLKYKKDNVKFHYVVYSHKDRKRYFNGTLDDGVNILGYNCFSQYFLLTSINLPSTIKAIHAYCFYDCWSLKSINLPSTIKSLSGGCFLNCSSLENINLPSHITSLGKYCFCGCESISLINLPSLLKSIGESCFKRCYSLKSIDLPSKITSIGDNCFSECSDLKWITVEKDFLIKDINFSNSSNVKIIERSF